ncbi:MAG TPA: PPE family protein, partial [Mycobacterium sp.]|nr:PPE family protein [Mycobacterium sp.]
MYAGAGAGPLLAAASGWDRVAGQLGSAAEECQAVVSQLTDGPWRGAASAAMAAAVRPYLDWLRATGARAAQTAVQARLAAAAYQQAFAAMVPPSVVAANRAALTSLVAANVVGQNTVAIAANQAEYERMWAQDAAAMHSYAARSAAAATLPQFAPPPPTTDSATGPATAAAQNAAAPAQSGLQALGAQVMNLANGPLFNNATLSGLNSLGDSLSPALVAAAGEMFVSEGNILFTVPLMNATGKLAVLGPAAWAAAPLSAGLTSAVPEGAPGVSAIMGQATPLGGLSVPPSWNAGEPGFKLTAAALPEPGAAGSGGLPEVGAVPSGHRPGGPVAGVVNAPGRGASAAAAGREAAAPQPAGEGDGDVARDRPAAVRAEGPPTHRDRPPVTGRLTASERNELAALREEMADLTRECDAMTHLIKAAQR